ncbi:protein jim lovell isoform X2 [Halyomorpha halys]|uniref:protein jim lovell isoform X2 n=1 Tax=Halyomorpha halys TaxID=286706 RepID=UPI0006D515E5|nr:protein jim lovell isoform X2 [Halyomorpha halys]
MSAPHYSLRWNNHQHHLLTAFDTLLQNETLVDVTLVCEETSFKAHKVVLSACSPYFQRIFSETPCKHPVIVLKDLRGWEVQAIVDFMYRGEISVEQEQLTSLIKAAESLQVRGLAHTERIPVCGNDREPVRERYSPQQNFDSRLPTLPHLPNISFTEGRHCSSPLPRRKQLRKSLPKRKIGLHHPMGFAMLRNMGMMSRRWQARPRRRSGDTSGPQDLRTKTPEPRNSDTAENLSMKKQARQRTTPTPPQVNMKMESDDSEPPDSSQNQPVELTTAPQEPRIDFNNTEPMGMHPPHHDSPIENSFPHLASISALSLTPPHMFSLDSQFGGLFPGMDNCRNSLLNDLSEPRMDNHISSKKKMGRPKGQHSAPRGGPPRSWTNAELTEALQHVWNKKMTTSQASRIFGIPYNSLLMYVRGKYGKSLKLEQLKKECFGELGGPLDLLGLGNISNNNNPSKPKIPEPDLMLGPPGFNPGPYPTTNFYPDFGASFPVPVGMVHLLPQSEKNREPVDFAKEESRATPMEYPKEELRNSPMALDFVKEEAHGNNCIENEESNSPRAREIQQAQNGQD